MKYGRASKPIISARECRAGQGGDDDQDGGDQQRLPGMLRQKGLLVRITRTMIEAEITDSTNHPVRNWFVEAFR